MAIKLVGRETIPLIELPVTGRVDRVLPIQRESEKLAIGRQTLARCMAVDFGDINAMEIHPYTPDMLYTLLERFGYQWISGDWRKVYPYWIGYKQVKRG